MDNNFNRAHFAGGIAVGYGLAVAIGLAAQKMLDSRTKRLSAETIEVDREDVVVAAIQRLTEAAADDAIDKQDFLQIFTEECVWIDTVIHNTDS